MEKRGVEESINYAHWLLEGTIRLVDRIHDVKRKWGEVNAKWACGRKAGREKQRKVSLMSPVPSGDSPSPSLGASFPGTFLSTCHLEGP